MLIDNTPEYDEIWNMVDERLKFAPSVNPGVIPFEIDVPHKIYSIENMNDVPDLNELIRNCLIDCSGSDAEWYALDWQHSAFIFDPRNSEDMQSVTVKDPRYMHGEYNAYFPGFYPDGDYYFFIDKSFRNGYLGHPWRQEIWVFGEALILQIDKILPKLGWTVKENP